MEELTLSCLDRLVRVYTRLLFCYEKTPNLETLEKALKTVIQRDYQPWLGTVTQVDQRTTVLRYDPHAVPTLGKVTLDCAFADVRGSDGSFRSLPAALIVPQTLVISEEAAQALYLVLFTFAKSDGCVLAVSLNHQVGDGSAHFSFVQAWCNEARGLKHERVSALVHDRSTLLMAASPPSQVPPEFRYMVTRAPSAPPCESSTELIRFPAKALSALKSQVAAAIAAPHYVSTNDVLLAVLFRAVARAKTLAPDSPIFMKFNVDPRTRDLGIPVGFTGNATLFTLVEPQNVSQLLTTSLAQVALWFRAAITAHTKASVADTMCFLDQYATRDLHESFLASLPYLHISNWDSLGDLTSYDFGTGPAAAVRLPPIGFDSIFYVLPALDGVECVVSLAPEVLAKFNEDKELLLAGAEVMGEFSQPV